MSDTESTTNQLFKTREDMVEYLRQKHVVISKRWLVIVGATVLIVSGLSLTQVPGIARSKAQEVVTIWVESEAAAEAIRNIQLMEKQARDSMDVIERFEQSLPESTPFHLAQLEQKVHDLQSDVYSRPRILGSGYVTRVGSVDESRTIGQSVGVENGSTSGIYLINLQTPPVGDTVLIAISDGGSNGAAARVKRKTPMQFQVEGRSPGSDALTAIGFMYILIEKSPAPTHATGQQGS